MMSRELIGWVVGVIGLLLATVGCTTPDAAGTSRVNVDKALAVPADYKEQVARYFAANIQGGPILRAEIAMPGMWDSPPRSTGPRPIVCAKWVSQGPASRQKGSLLFTFENGQIAEAFDPGSTSRAAGDATDAALKEAAICGRLAYVPFPEIVKSR